MTQKIGWMARQGDVLIMKVAEGATIGEKLDREQGRIVLAHGEVTGHAHAIASRSATLYALPIDRSRVGDEVWTQAEKILIAKRGVALRHEEHATIDIPPGTHVVRRQREWTDEDDRAVAD